MLIIVIVVAVVIVFGFIGAIVGAVTGAPRGPECAACAGLDRWYASLGWLAKLGASIYYAAMKASCAVNGCPTR